MATILEFIPKRCSGTLNKPRPASGSSSHSCEIFIFPGVRVEHDEFDLASRLPAPPGKRGPRHKTGGK